MGEARLFCEKPAGDAALGAPAALAAADRERPGRGLRHSRRGGSEPDSGCGQEGLICLRLRHGHAMMALLAILNPKLDPGDRLVKKDLSSFFLSPSSRGFGFATEAEQPAGDETSVTGSLSSNSKSMKNSGSATRKRHELGERSRGLEGQRDVELDQMVGPLLHPVIRHRAEFSRLPADLERGEIADLGEALGVFLGERGELLALDEFAFLGEPLRREGRIHLVEHPVVDDARDFSVGGEGEVALHRHPDVGMGGGRLRRRDAEREPQRRNPSTMPFSQAQRVSSPWRPDPAARRLLGAK